MPENVPQMSTFRWNPKTSEAATLLAQGYTYQQVADAISVSTKTIQRWMADVDFSAEVDRLSLMVGVAARAERLRIAQRIVREKMSHGILASDKDLLDWLKYAQTETDGLKLDLTALAAAFGADAPSVAASRPGRVGEDHAGELVN